MASEKRWFAAQAAIWGLVFGIACATGAWAQGDGKQPKKRDGGKQAAAEAPAQRLTPQEVIKKVYPAIVEVRTDHNPGGGFVVDAAKSWVATNFHVVAGATKGAVVFPSDKDGKEYAIDGFIGALPGRDLAILHIQAGDKKLTALELASKIPEQGETVYAFGSPPGLSGTITISKGTVSAIRTGQELANLFDRTQGKGFFQAVTGYDVDCVWIQHNAAVSHGNTGGPLVNGQAEVVGLNTLLFDPTGNWQDRLNFAISAKHLKAALATADNSIKPLAKLPRSQAVGSFGEMSSGRGKHTAGGNGRPTTGGAMDLQSAECGQLLDKAAPAVVAIRTGDKTGQGVVIDADKGLIATTYRLIEGTKKATVTFPFDKDKKEYAVDGFVAILPRKDLALLRVKLGQKKPKSAQLTAKMPAQGDWAYVLCPARLPASHDTVAGGIVVAIRSAEEIALMFRYTSNGAPRTPWPSDRAGTWIEHDAVVEFDGVGGPVFNQKGDLLGLNSRVANLGRDLAFAISAGDLQEFLTSAADKTVEPLEKLPPPRPTGSLDPTGRNPRNFRNVVTRNVGNDKA